MKTFVYLLIFIFATVFISSDLVYSQPVAHWTFTEMSGTTLIDHSIYGNNGQIYGATWQQPNGLRSLLFDGSYDYVSVPHNSIFNFGTGNFTIEAQFNTSVVPTYSWSAIFSKHNTANWHDKEIFLGILGATGVPFISLSDGTGYFETAYGTTNVCDGLFHTVRGVREGNQLMIYVDGDIEATVSASINPDNTNPANIGRSSYAGGNGHFNGIISNISLWNIAFPGEVAHWTFTEMSGTTLIDHSIYGNNGQIYGATWQQPNGLRSLLFDGSYDYVSVPHNSIFNFGTGNFTIEAQFNTSVVPTYSWSAIFSKHNTANWHDKEIFLGILGGTGVPFISLSDGTGYFETAYGTTNVCDGLFHTVRGVREGNQLMIYVDGDIKETVSASINPDNTNPVNIGRSSYAGGNGHFNGIISNISLWNINITPVETGLNYSLTEYELFDNYPNPFNPSTTIKFEIPELSFVTLKVYDILGGEISTLINEEKSSGSYEVEFDASDLPSGIYFYKLQTENFAETKKMTLLK